MRTLAAPELVTPVPLLTAARIVAVPTSLPANRVVAALPLTSCRFTDCGPPIELKPPSVVVTATTVPSGGACPVSERTTEMFTLAKPVPPATISDGLGVTVTLKVTWFAGGFGVTGVLPPGSVGEEVQPTTTARADAANRRMEFRKRFILELLHPSRRDIDGERGRRRGDVVAGQCAAEELIGDVQDD